MQKKGMPACPCCGSTPPTPTCDLYAGALDRCCSGDRDNIYEGATIHVTGPSGYDETRTQGDGGGYEIFPPVEDGEDYTITVSAPGRITRTKTQTVRCYSGRTYLYANLWPETVKLKVCVTNPACPGSLSRLGQCGNPPDADPNPSITRLPGIAGVVVTVTGVVEGASTSQRDAGRVNVLSIDCDGDPAPGLLVRLYATTDLVTPVASATTGADGRCSFVVDIFRSYVAVGTDPVTMASATTSPFTPDYGADVTLRPPGGSAADPGRLEVTLRDSDGFLLTSGQATVATVASPLVALATATMSGAGVAVFTGLPTGVALLFRSGPTAGRNQNFPSFTLGAGCQGTAEARESDLLGLGQTWSLTQDCGCPGVATASIVGRPGGGTRTGTTGSDGCVEIEFDAPISGVAHVAAALPSNRRGWVPVPVELQVGTQDPAVPCADPVWGFLYTLSNAELCTGRVQLGWESEPEEGFFCDCCIDPLPEALPYSDANGSTELHRVDFSMMLGGVMTTLSGWLGCVTATGKPTVYWDTTSSPGCWRETTGDVTYFVFYSCFGLQRLVDAVVPNCDGTFKAPRPYSVGECTAARFLELRRQCGNGLNLCLWTATDVDCDGACESAGSFSISFDDFIGGCYEAGLPDLDCGHFGWIQGPGTVTE
jgi:hypothetical protein